MKDTDYAYAVARIRANESKLLTASDIENLINAGSLGEAFSILQSKGWIEQNSENRNITCVLSDQSKKLWSLLCESVPDKDELRVFTVFNDFFNIKAALKCMLTADSPERFFAYPTSLDTELVKNAVEKHDFSLLGEAYAEPLRDAYETACRTENGQSADIILDCAALNYVQKLSSESNCALVREITDFVCAAADIKIAVRCARTGKSLSFAETAIAPCNGLEKEKLASLSVEGEKELFDYLKGTNFAEGCAILEQDSAAFEKWCDDTVTEMTKKAKFVFFGFEPICAYYYAKQTELKSVRIILCSKESGLSSDIIRKRVRATPFDSRLKP